MNLKSLKRNKGFTLIELLVVVLILTALGVSVFVALNPTKRIQDANNARRTQDVDAILSAIHSYIVDNKGALPAGVTTTEVQLGTSATGCTVSTGGCNVSAAACTDLSTPLVKYLKAIPIDPNGTAAKTSYSVVSDANNIVTVRACASEGTATISASR